jgi:hypothetical protein
VRSSSNKGRKLAGPEPGTHAPLIGHGKGVLSGSLFRPTRRHPPSVHLLVSASPFSKGGLRFYHGGPRRTTTFGPGTSPSPASYPSSRPVSLPAEKGPAVHSRVRTRVSRNTATAPRYGFRSSCTAASKPRFASQRRGPALLCRQLACDGRRVFVERNRRERSSCLRLPGRSGSCRLISPVRRRYDAI